MRTDNQPEEFGGQQLLALDSRSEKPLRHCPACSSSESRRVGIKNELEIVSCTNCNSLYTPYTPWYTSKIYYGNYYEERICEEPPIVHKRLREITAQFSKYRQTNRLLDVGCGAGLLMQAARDHGWNAEGIDVSESSVRHVQAMGLEAFHGELQDAKFQEGQFDVITAAEIVEHLFDPMAVVSEVHRLLRPGGLFWLTTPHVRSITARVKGLNWRCVCPPEHLQLFSITGLQALLQRAGFREVRFQTTGVDPVELWQALKKQKAESPLQNAEDVRTKYELNDAMTRSNSRRVLKSTVNKFLNLTRLGDNLKAFAIR